MKELKFEELTLKQKLGMTFTAYANGWTLTEEREEWIIEKIKEKAIGALWIVPNTGHGDKLDKFRARVKEVLDYPLLIITDAESGFGDYLVGKHNAIGAAGSEECAYAFGKLVAVSARKKGYNVVCDPVLDLSDSGSQRSLGQDKFKVAALAKAIARGMHDGGVLTIGKHYPGGNNPLKVDSHMAESISYQTEEELLDYSLYPYLELMKEGLLDGLMTSHKRFVNIDPDYPASLSKKVNDILRRQGFDGIAITDALCMMGILSKFGYVESKGLAIAGGNDLSLPYFKENDEAYDAFMKCWDMGMITEERLNEAVRRVLEAQAKTLKEPKFTEITEEDVEVFERINRNVIYADLDEGFAATLDRDKKYFFALMARPETNIEGAKPGVDTFNNGWYYIDKISDRLTSLFPNSKIKIFHEFPTQGQCYDIVDGSQGYDDVVFFTFTEPLAYTGPEQLTHRLVTLVKAMQMTDRISTLVHFGNPFVLEELPHIHRVLIGGNSENSVNAAIDVLAGKNEAKGVLTYDVKLQ